MAGSKVRGKRHVGRGGRVKGWEWSANGFSVKWVSRSVLWPMKKVACFFWDEFDKASVEVLLAKYTEDPGFKLIGLVWTGEIRIYKEHLAQRYVLLKAGGQ